MKTKGKSLVKIHTHTHTLCLVNKVKIKLNIEKSKSYSVSIFDTSQNSYFQYLELYKNYKGEKIMNKQEVKNIYKKYEGITLIALVITILFSYDEKLKCSNSKGFLLTTIQKL